jgi:DNA-binding CsgD family transcriptional regulator
MIPRALRRIADLIDHPCQVVGESEEARYLNARARELEADRDETPICETELIWVAVNGDRYALQVDHSAIERPSREHAWRAQWGLSPRHTKVAELAMQGLSDKQIADKTGLQFNTVRTYMQAIRKAAGVSNRTELLHAAVQLGMKPQGAVPAAPPEDHG